MSQAAPRPLAAAALVIGAAAAFGLMPLFTRLAGAPVLGLSAWRAAIVALFFAGAAVLWEGGRAALWPSASARRMGMLLGLAQALASATFVGGYAHTTVANAVFLHSLAPLLVFPLAARFFGERPGSAALAGGLLSLIGVALLSGVSLLQRGQAADSRFLLGDGLSLLSAAGYAAVLVLTRASRREGLPLWGTLAVAWATAALVLGLIALIGGQLWIPASAAPGTLALALVSTALPFWLLNLGLRSLPVGQASVLALSEVVFAALVGALAFGESLSGMGQAGGLLVALGVAYALLGEAGAEAAEGEALSAEARPWRGARTALALLLLNAGAAAALRGQAGGEAVAWAGLGLLARLGLPLGRWALEGRAAALLGGAALLLQCAALVGLLGGLRGGPSPGLALGLLALAAAAADAALLRREPRGEADGAHLGRLGLLCLGSGMVAAAADHGAAALLQGLGALGLGLSAADGALGLARARLGRSAGGPLAPLEGRLSALRGPPLALAALACWALGGLRVVEAGEAGIVERLGQPQPKALHPGLHLLAPAPIDRLSRVEVGRQRRLEVITPDTPVLAGDHALLTLSASLHFRVADPAAWLFHSADPEATLAALARSALVSELAHRAQDDVLTDGRAEVEQATVTALAARARPLGVEGLSLHLQSVSVPGPVSAAFLDVLAAAEQRETAINRAQAWAADRLPRASGEAVARVAEARGEAALIAARAEGERALLQALHEGGARDPASTLLRLQIESRERALSDRPLVLASPDLRLWLGQPAPPERP